MIDESQEELAALYAFDLLEGAELAAFESALAADPELRRLVDSLRGTAADLALAAPDIPPPSPALRARILNSAVPLPRAGGNGYVLPFTPSPWFGWAAAACFLVASIFFAAKSFNVRGQLQLALDAERVARLEAGTFKNLLEAERILSRGQLDHLVNADRLIADLRVQADVARLKISTLTSLAGNSPTARAVAVWNPDSQEGVLVVSRLPALEDDKDYQLWVIDPQYPIPVDGGVFTVDAQTGDARVNFHPGKNIKVAQTFAVSLERRGGVPKAEGPMMLISN
ncbi:MAG: anti-sigma factor [Opitutaceae bacterium]|jgi:anti-sigma-K factor RskA